MNYDETVKSIRMLESKARVLRKINPYNRELESLKKEIEAIRDMFNNPNAYKELLNSEDYFLELKELEEYVDEKINGVKKRIENINNDDLEEKYKKELSNYDDLLNSVSSAEKRLAIWEKRKSKTNSVSPALQKKIDKINSEISDLWTAIELSKMSSIELHRQMSFRPSILEKEHAVLNRFLALKDSIATRKKSEFKKFDFMLLRNKAQSLEQVFFSILNLRQSIIDKNKEILEDEKLNSYDLPPFNYSLTEKNYHYLDINYSGNIDNDLQQRKDALNNFMIHSRENGYSSDHLEREATDLYKKIDNHSTFFTREAIEQYTFHWLDNFKTRITKIDQMSFDSVRNCIDDLRKFEQNLYSNGWYLDSFAKDFGYLYSKLNAALHRPAEGNFGTQSNSDIVEDSKLSNLQEIIRRQKEKYATYDEVPEMWSSDPFSDNYKTPQLDTRGLRK